MSKLVTTDNQEQSAIATPAAKPRRQAQAKASAEAAAQSSALNAFRSGEESPEALILAQHYVAGVATGARRHVAAGMAGLDAMIASGGLGGAIDLGMVQSAIDELEAPVDGAIDWAGLLA